MVAHEAPERKAINNSKSSKYITFSVTFCLFFAITLAVAFIIYNFTKPKESGPYDSDSSFIPEPEPEPEPELPPSIDFQSIVDSFVNSTRGNRSVLVYDIERDETVGEFNPSESYNTASLYKLFVVYEGYRRIQSGALDPNEIAGYTGYTVLECLDKSIRESYSPCAETLWNMIGHEELDSIVVKDYGIVNSSISNLISNPNDILAIMKRFYTHPDFNDPSLISVVKDSLLVQPPTTYNWRQGLPSGFSRANVYDKVGWDYNADGGYWNIYHDAAIVEFPEFNRHFVVVVMTNQVSFTKIREFGANFENHFYSIYPTLVSTEEL